jgi:hypothetical protein
MKGKGILIATFVVFAAVIAPDAKACQGCCFDPPYYTAKCCYAICGAETCRVQATSLGPYCIRIGDCAEDEFACWVMERWPEFMFARCNAAEPRQLALVKVKIKRRYNARA